MIVTLIGEDLVSLVDHRPDLFYPQTWYKREEFARRQCFGDYEVGEGFEPLLLPMERTPFKPFPAAVYAAAYIQSGGKLWPDRYIWTSDRDHNNDPVYVGCSKEYGGLQVHRHLQITDRWGIAA